MLSPEHENIKISKTEPFVKLDKVKKIFPKVDFLGKMKDLNYSTTNFQKRTRNVQNQIFRQDLKIDLSAMSRRISNLRLMVDAIYVLFVHVPQHYDKSIFEQFQNI